MTRPCAKPKTWRSTEQQPVETAHESQQSGFLSSCHVRCDECTCLAVVAIKPGQFPASKYVYAAPSVCWNGHDSICFAYTALPDLENNYFPCKPMLKACIDCLSTFVTGHKFDL